MTVIREPALCFRRELVPGSIVDNQEDLLTVVLCNQPFEERPERLSVEDIGKPKRKAGFVKRDGAKQMCCFSLSVRVNAWLTSNPCPRLVQRTVEPETGLVFEKDYTTASRSLFFILGSLVRNQYSCNSASARARRFRGRCTEKPSLCNKRGM
jgi:hypothetical protein